MKILAQLLQIIRLQRQPQDLEHDEFAALFYVVAAIGLGYIANVYADHFGSPLGSSLIQNVALVGALWGVLALNQKSPRFIQTCTAMFGVGTILGLLKLGLLFVPGLGLLFLLVSGWGLYIMVLILRAAIECSTLNALLIVIALEMISALALFMLFPTEFQQLLEAARSASK